MICGDSPQKTCICKHREGRLKPRDQKLYNTSRFCLCDQKILWNIYMNKNHDQEKSWIRSTIYIYVTQLSWLRFKYDSKLYEKCAHSCGNFRIVSLTCPQHFDSKYVSRFYAKTAYPYFVIKVTMFPGLGCFKVQLLNDALLMWW